MELEVHCHSKLAAVAKAALKSLLRCSIDEVLAAFDLRPHSLRKRSAEVSNLNIVAREVEEKVGKIPFSGRYHRLPKRITDEYIITDKVLGVGHSGAVRLARSCDRKRKFAVKTLSLANTSIKERELLECEVEVFLQMDHPHVVRLYDVYEAVDSLHLVMEYMEGGELFDRILSMKKFSEKSAAVAVWQMLWAVNYLHSHGIVHRDLKLENFMYDHGCSGMLKLIDFGFSRVVKPGTMMRQCVGTVSYVAPEVLEGSYTSMCDMWSLGVLTFTLLTGQMPFNGEEAYQAKCIRRGLYKMIPERWRLISTHGKDFTQSLLCVNPEDRLSAESALKHPWIMRACGTASQQIGKPVADALRTFANASRFKRCCLEMMAWCLSAEETANVHEDFRNMDANGQGTITFSELHDVLVRNHSVTDEEVWKVFRAMDTNNDLEIHYSDFLAAMLTTRINLDDSLFRMAFKKFDTDSSGFITFDNLREVLGDFAKGTHVSELLAEADYIKDGRISYDEFVTFLEKPSPPLDDGISAPCAAGHPVVMMKSEF